MYNRQFDKLGDDGTFADRKYNRCFYMPMLETGYGKGCHFYLKCFASLMILILFSHLTCFSCSSCALARLSCVVCSDCVYVSV